MKCDYCESTQDITTINSKHACIAHIDSAMGEVLSPVKEMIGKLNRPDLRCVVCGLPPSAFSAYVHNGEDMSADDYVWREEGTLDRGSGGFLCDADYMKYGQPTGSDLPVPNRNARWTATPENVAYLLGVG